MGRRARIVGLAVIALTAAAPAVAEEGNVFTNMLKYGGTTVPPSQPKDLGDAYCPPVAIADGGSALQSYGGKAGSGSALRTQTILGRLARECALRVDGSVSVRVGVEGRVLLGPAGSPGRFETLVQIAIKHDGQVVIARSRKASVTLGAGEMGGEFAIVEDNLEVPAAMAEDYEIEVRLGAAPARAATTKRKPQAKTSESFAPGTGGEAK